VTRDRTQASAGIAKKFIDQFFGGSASELVMSLLGSKKIRPGEIERLRKLLDESKGTKNDGSHK
jgi:predicted transcriptional regulator